MMTGNRSLLIVDDNPDILTSLTLLLKSDFSRIDTEVRPDFIPQRLQSLAYDVILLDSAPLLANADAGILARHADGSVLVVRERHCRRPEVIEALAVLGATGGRLLGTVFVGSEAGAGYGYYHAYANDHESASPSDDA